jgi:hypothetical protein
MIDYIHGADLATVPLPYSSLNPGIYYQQDAFPPINYNMILTVGNVPEPSVMGFGWSWWIGFLRAPCLFVTNEAGI